MAGLYANPESAMERMVRALVAAFKDITRDNGYGCDIGDVMTEIPSEGDLKNFPAVALIRGRTVIENQDQSDQAWHKLIPFTALVYLRDQDPTYGRLRVMQDIERKLGNDFMLPDPVGNPTAREVTFDGDAPFGMVLNKPQVGFTFGFTVHLAQDIKDPSVAA